MNTLPDLYPGRLLALVTPQGSSDIILTLAARLAARGPVHVLDGGNRFNAYGLARSLRRTMGSNLIPVLERVRVARAFTCYQMEALLAEAPGGSQPTLVINLLDTFYDESAPRLDRRRLVRACLKHLQRLSRQAVVVVSLCPPRRPQMDPLGLLPAVQSAADAVWFPEEPEPAHYQLPLFEAV